MYGYKQFHVWLVVIPFWVLHVFGAPSILSSFSRYDFFSLNKNSIPVNIFESSGLPQDDDFSQLEDNGHFDLGHILADDSYSNKYSKSLSKRLKKLKKAYNQEVFLCDNRIDRMGKRFTRYLSDKDLNVEDRAWVTIA